MKYPILNRKSAQRRTGDDLCTLLSEIPALSWIEPLITNRSVENRPLSVAEMIRLNCRLSLTYDC
jgi:hypothetical protein